MLVSKVNLKLNENMKSCLVKLTHIVILSSTSLIHKRDRNCYYQVKHPSALVRPLLLKKIRCFFLYSLFPDGNILEHSHNSRALPESCQTLPVPFRLTFNVHHLLVWLRLSTYPLNAANDKEDDDDRGAHCCQ